ncbi:MAG: Uncharacterized protein G01um101493_381 [Microgenomates group bacterium Gr01-1014_93]|nr:MAG: Uncharacterized protein G01um101493_381 [Microgenomates group bacterium Gr01-1014_93]
MESIYKDDRRREISKTDDISFIIETSGLYLIEISAIAKNEKQLGGTDDEDLRIEIDKRKFPQINNPHRYFDSPASFSGGTAKGLRKTIYFILFLHSGEHKLSLIPDISASLVKIEVFKLSEDSYLKDFNISLNEQAEDGDRRAWITFALVDLTLNQFTTKLNLKRRFIDSDDVKVIVDGIIKRNDRSILHKLWYFAASLLTGEDQTETFNVNLPAGLHYIEFWADRKPTFQSIIIKLGKINNEELKLKKYRDDKFGRDYNQLDGLIIKATKLWNNFFLGQSYPLPEPLDPNLVKAIIYRESRLGYFPDKNIVDVMQVWDPDNPVREAILGKTPANEFISKDKIGHISYSYPKNKTPTKVETREESIFWGVRWLYYKAQYILTNDDGNPVTPYVRQWRSWKEAVRSYNANPKLVEEYVKEVFSIYEKGVDLEGNILW